MVGALRMEAWSKSIPVVLLIEWRLGQLFDWVWPDAFWWDGLEDGIQTRPAVCLLWMKVVGFCNFLSRLTSIQWSAHGGVPGHLS